MMMRVSADSARGVSGTCPVIHLLSQVGLSALVRNLAQYPTLLPEYVSLSAAV